MEVIRSVPAGAGHYTRVQQTSACVRVCVSYLMLVPPGGLSEYCSGDCLNLTHNKPASQPQLISTKL